MRTALLILLLLIGCGKDTIVDAPDPFFLIGAFDSVVNWRHTRLADTLIESDVRHTWTFRADSTYTFTRVVEPNKRAVGVLRLLPVGMDTLWQSHGTWRLTGCSGDDWHCEVVGYRTGGELWHWDGMEKAPVVPGPISLEVGAINNQHVVLGQTIYERVP